jgi:two-component system chemotaxis response regulator CheY
VHALVLDDSRAIRAILSGILKEIGFSVTEGANGKDGLERLMQMGRADLALVDWNMPEMDGYEFVQAVRAREEHRAMRIVMVTTETEVSQMSRALEAGANEYVMKPFSKDVITEKLETLGVCPH